MKVSYFFSVFLILFSGCNSQNELQQSNNDTLVDIDCTVTINLLKNPAFDSQDGRLLSWERTQHTGEKSFEVDITDGVLRIEKIATQPWFSYSQKITDITQLKSKTLVFSAELKLNLNTDNLTHDFKKGGGLTIDISGNTDILGNDELLFTSVFDHEPHIGTTDWENVAIKFDIPASATQLVVGFLHQANGVMSLRKPGLHVCEQ